jgi:hypothetical protein
MKLIHAAVLAGLSVLILLESGCVTPARRAARVGELTGYWENFDFEHNRDFDQFEIHPDARGRIVWYVEYETPARVQLLRHNHFRLISTDKKQSNRRYIVSEEFVSNGKSITRIKDGLVFHRRPVPVQKKAR